MIVKAASILCAACLTCSFVGLLAGAAEPHPEKLRVVIIIIESDDEAIDDIVEILTRRKHRGVRLIQPEKRKYEPPKKPSLPLEDKWWDLPGGIS